MEVMASNANEEAEDRQRQAELSKYLGGDEEHTHLVKGLDLALAQKVRREEMGEDAYGDFGEGTGDLDQLLEESYAQKQKQSQLDNKSSTPKNTGDLQTLNPQSELGTSMLSYLLRQQQSKSFSSTSTLLSNNIKINSAIQKSFLTFSLESDVRRRKTAWEVPRVSIQVMISRHGGADNDQSSQKATPLDHQLLVSISNALSGSKRLRGERSKEGNRKKGRVQFNGEGMHGSKKNNDHAGEKEGKDAGDDNSNITTGSNAKAEPKKEVDDDDSDDDIFENVGTYVPEKSNESKTANEGDTEDGSSNKIEDAHKNIAGSSEVDHQQKKQSIFENLVTPSDQPAPNNTQHHHQHRKIQQLSPTRKNKNIIDRNIFGGASDSQHNAESSLNKRRGPVSAAMEGVSMTNYRGGYGEEMDVDFGNFDEVDQEQNSEKEKDAQGGKAGGDEEE